MREFASALEAFTWDWWHSLLRDTNPGDQALVVDSSHGLLHVRKVLAGRRSRTNAKHDVC